jgi:hypothetical protein
MQFIYSYMMPVIVNSIHSSCKVLTVYIFTPLTEGSLDEQRNISARYNPTSERVVLINTGVVLYFYFVSLFRCFLFFLSLLGLILWILWIASMSAG